MSDLTVLELKNQLEKAQSEIAQLEKKYDSDLVEMRKEIDFLKEQLMAQQGMLTDAIDYATKLESQFNELKTQIKKGNFESIH
ncbi:MAG: chromosome segregation ATPase [Marivirga sp.]|jgi:chromosome segregation ATPase